MPLGALNPYPPWLRHWHVCSIQFPMTASQFLDFSVLNHSDDFGSYHPANLYARETNSKGTTENITNFTYTVNGWRA